MNINGICPYETPCGWCTKWDKKCDKKIGRGDDKPKRGLRAKTSIMDEVCDYNHNDKFVNIINDLKNNTQPKISQNNTEEGLK